ncbi:hypothetical protein AGLY_015303 [Aphis glycines]|uniref:Uncharacterized protein n=1 Tax=Aphis glycines TaxID=307491 RepID=A0A6G0T238_APHGL|nr:hypothetical protein AGLY_015303 [Aphis glycines]
MNFPTLRLPMACKRRTSPQCQSCIRSMHSRIRLKFRLPGALYELCKYFMKFYQAWKISPPASNYVRERHASDSERNNFGYNPISHVNTSTFLKNQEFFRDIIDKFSSIYIKTCLNILLLRQFRVFTFLMATYISNCMFRSRILFGMSGLSYNYLKFGERKGMVDVCFALILYDQFLKYELRLYLIKKMGNTALLYSRIKVLELFTFTRHNFLPEVIPKVDNVLPLSIQDLYNNFVILSGFCSFG